MLIVDSGCCKLADVAKMAWRRADIDSGQRLLTEVVDERHGNQPARRASSMDWVEINILYRPLVDYACGHGDWRFCSQNRYQG